MSTPVLPAPRAPEEDRPVEAPPVETKSTRERWLSPLPPGRIVGIDVARFLALIGMVLAHTAVMFTADLKPNWVSHIAAGRASALFALLAGVSLALMTGGSQPLRGLAARKQYVGLAVRAVLVFLIGLALAVRSTQIQLILPVYAVLFLLTIPFLRLRARTLLVFGGAWAIAGPLLLWTARLHDSGLGEHSGNLTFTGIAQHPWESVINVALGGVYPGVVWFAYVLLGAGIGRCDLRSWRPAAWMAGVGAALLALAQGLARFAPPVDAFKSDPAMQSTTDKLIAAGSLSNPDPAMVADMMDKMNQAMYGDPATLLAAGAHSGTIGDLLNTIGSALLVLGLCLLIVRGAFRWWKIVAGAGAMTLTLYIVHVFLTGLPFATIEAHPLRWNIAVLLPIGFLFGLLGRSGPAEKAVAWLSGQASCGRPVLRTPAHPRRGHER